MCSICQLVPWSYNEKGRGDGGKAGRMEEEQTVWPALSPVLPSPTDQTLCSVRVDKAKQRIPERPQLLDGVSRTVGRESSRQLVAWRVGASCLLLTKPESPLQASRSEPSTDATVESACWP